MESLKFVNQKIKYMKTMFSNIYRWSGKLILLGALVLPQNCAKKAEVESVEIIRPVKYAAIGTNGAGLKMFLAGQHQWCWPARNIFRSCTI